MDDVRKELGLRIRAVRTERGFSQVELAERVKISPSHMSDIENGKKNIGVDIFLRLVRELNTSADYLLQTGADEDDPAEKKVLELLSGCSREEKQLILRIAQDLAQGLGSLKD